jgi:tRNA A37 methylthiotransferase MiaB
MQKDFVSPAEIRRRSSRLAKLARKVALEKNRCWIGWTGDILVDEVGKISGSWIGRNFAYKPITVKSTAKLLGKTLRVRIGRIFPTYLEGAVVE